MAMTQPPDGLAVRVERPGSAVHLVVAGELDLATSRFLSDALDAIERDRPEKVVIDLTNVSFIDNTGVYVVFAACLRAARSGDVELSIRPGRAAVQRAFRLAGVESELPFADL